MQPNYAALSASDGSGEPVLAIVQAPGRSIGSVSIPVNATTNWPTGTFIATTGTLQSDGTLNPTTVQVFYGTTLGTTITITSFAAGYSDVGNSTGDVVVVKPTTEWANIVAQGINSTSLFPDQFANFVEPAGGVWSTSSGLVGSMTAGNVWYNGVRSSMPVITTHTFTASKDTYVDFNPSTNTFTYVPETNGAAEPAVTASSLRVALVVTGSSTVTSIYQAKYQKAVPLVWQYLGSVSIATSPSSTSTSYVEVTGVTVPVIVPTNVTKVKIGVSAYDIGCSVVFGVAIYRGATAGALTTLVQDYIISAGGNVLTLQAFDTPSAGTYYYTLAYQTSNASDAVSVSYGSSNSVTLEVEAC